MSHKSKDCLYINNGTRNDLIEKLVEMMDALVGVPDERVQYVRFEKRALVDDSGADLVVRNGATITEGGHDTYGKAYSIRFNVVREKGETK